MMLGSLEPVAPYSLRLAIGCRRLWWLGYRHGAWAGGMVLGATILAESLMDGLLGDRGLRDRAQRVGADRVVLAPATRLNAVGAGPTVQHNPRSRSRRGSNDGVSMIVEDHGHARLALACGAVAAMLGGPLAADECSDYRVAGVRYEAAGQAFDDRFAAMVPIGERATSKDKAELAPYEEEQNRALRALEEAARAVRRSLDDEAAVATIDAIQAARVALKVAWQRERDWTDPILSVSIDNPRGTIADLGPHFGRAFWKLNEAYGAATAAYYHALHFACRESAP